MHGMDLAGLGSLIAFAGFSAVAFLVILIFAIVNWIKNKTGKIQKPYSAYMLAAFGSFIVGTAGAVTISIDILNRETRQVLDSWGTACIIIVSLILSFFAGINFKKNNKG